MKAEWRTMYDLSAIPRPRLWGGWSGPGAGYVVLELADTNAGNPIVQASVDVDDPPRWLAWLLDRLNRRTWEA